MFFIYFPSKWKREETMSFVHLHTHSEYTLLESTCSINQLLDKCVEYKMPSIALTDRGNMFGIMEFYFQAKERGIHSVLGTEFYVGRKVEASSGSSSSPSRKYNIFPLVLLAQNQEGYHNLCQLQALSHDHNYHQNPRQDFPWLPEEKFFQYRTGLFALSGGLQGGIASNLLERREDAALAYFQWLHSLYGINLYLELQRPAQQMKIEGAWEKVNSFLRELSQKYKVPVVAAHELFLISEDQRLLQKVLYGTANNKTLGEIEEHDLPFKDATFKSPTQMLQLFKDLPEACENTMKIAESCQVHFTLKDERGRKIYHLAQMSFKDGKSSEEHLTQLAHSGLKRRLELKKCNKTKGLVDISSSYPSDPNRSATLRAKDGDSVSITKDHDDTQDNCRNYLDPSSYEVRLKEELKVIIQMGFSDYFLIVHDFICWAKEQGIPVGPGRGSGAGSLVSYSLGITELDPLQYNLFFERFLNLERISMPDFDIDFCPQGRERVLDYVAQKYGKDRVAQIITYGKFQARAAVRDVGRVMGISLSEVDSLAKLIPPQPIGITLKKALKVEPRLKMEMEKEAGINELMQSALKLEGYIRHQGVHAAGVIISQKPLTHYTPLCRGREGEVVCQYDMKSLEKIGLVKFDFLGLKTLTHIHLALKFIKENHGKEITLASISLEDPNIYKLMCLGNTAGIFQFEGIGMSNAIAQIQPSCFEHIVAINALYRPGPMEMIPEFAKRKKGTVQIEYLLPQLEPILNETYGVMIYQEQVMRIAVEIAGYTGGEADLLRRAMGKKQKEEMDKQKKRFVQGVIQKGHSKQKGEKLFQLMEKFADYGFNKAHAAAYCVVAAHTAWLKNYYPTEFFAALLSLEMNNTDRMIHYVTDARSNGIHLYPPHINQSQYTFSIQKGAIYFGLGAIKGVGKSMVEAIIVARNKLEERKQQQGFKSLKEFFTEVDMSALNKKTLESFIYAGALDNFGQHRAQLIKNYPNYLKYALRRGHEKQLRQTNLFSFEEEINVIKAKSWSVLDKLAYEKQVLGFYLTDHPLKLYEKACRSWYNTPISSLRELQGVNSISGSYQRSNQGQKQKFKILAVISKIKERVTKKKGQRMAFVSIEDRTGSIDILVFPSVFAEEESKLKSGLPLLMVVQLDDRGGEGRLILDRSYTVETFLNKAREVIFHLDHHFQEKDCMRLHTLLKNHKGEVRAYLHVQQSKKEEPWQMEIHSVKLDAFFFEQIYNEFGRSDFLQIG